MTLNDLEWRKIALILRYFTEFDSCEGQLRHRVGRQAYLSAEYRLSLSAKTDPFCSAVSAIAELVVYVFGHVEHCIYGICAI